MEYVRDAVQEGWRPEALQSDANAALSQIMVDPETSLSVGGTVSAVLLGRALDTVSDGSLITDADQNVVYANKAFEAVTGYSREEMLGHNCRVLA